MKNKVFEKHIFRVAFNGLKWPFYAVCGNSITIQRYYQIEQHRTGASYANETHPFPWLCPFIHSHGDHDVEIALSPHLLFQMELFMAKKAEQTKRKNCDPL